MATATDAVLAQHWLLVATDRRASTGRRYSALEIFRLRCQDRFWGCSAATPYRRRLRAQDHAIVYLGGSGGHQAVASARFASGLVTLSIEERRRLRHGDDALDMPAGVYLETVEVWPRPVPFTPEVRAKLAFLGDKERWVAGLQGTFVPITPEDYTELRLHGGMARPSAALYGSRFTPAEPSVPTGPTPRLEPDRVQVPSEGLLLGHRRDNGHPLYWAPRAEKNPHLLVVGLSGTGKTETLRTIIYELRRQHVPVLILDRHDEFRAVADLGLDLGKDVALNPLELLGRRPSFVIYELLQILERLLQLGAQQRATLRSAIQQAYEAAGIKDRDPSTWTKAPPSFHEVHQVLEQLRTDSPQRQLVTRLTNRLDFLFDLDVFAAQTYIPFSRLLERATAIRLAALPSDRAKDIVTEFLLRRLWDYLQGQGQTAELRLFAVLDEAHRLAYEGSALGPFLREALKYGLGMLLASQRPHDFAETILANVATLITLQCTLVKDARFVAQHINCGPSEVQNLTRRGEVLVKFASGPYPQHAQIWPSFARTASAS